MAYISMFSGPDGDPDFGRDDGPQGQDMEPPPRLSKAGLYGCLACDCEGCTDAECTPGAERATEDQAVELGWLTRAEVDAHRAKAKGERQ